MRLIRVSVKIDQLKSPGLLARLDQIFEPENMLYLVIETIQTIHGESVIEAVFRS